MIRPHLEYCNVIWSPLFKRQSIKIEAVQRRATKTIISLKDLPYKDRLKSLQIPSLKYRRLRGDLIQCYKIMKGIDQVNLSKSLIINNNNTRGHPFRLSVLSRNSSLRSNVFSNRVVDVWNNLPEFVVMSTNINHFKNLLDQVMENNMYEYDE